MKGAPREVGRNFSCGTNQITSLKDAPEKIGGDFECVLNKITSLEGVPKEIYGNFDCSMNLFTSLVGAPEKVDGDFKCTDNPLTSLKGAPKEIGGKFECPSFELDAGEWNPKGWTTILAKRTPRMAADVLNKAKELILTIFSAEALNQQIQKDPAGMMMALKSVLKDPGFSEIESKLVWPKGYEDEVELVGGLSSLGF